MSTAVADYEVPPQVTDSATGEKESEWQTTTWNQYLGYYKTIPEYKTAINGFATWVLGKGWTSDSRTTSILDNISGWGEDTIQSILWNMIVTKKINGDAFAEVIRNEKTGTLINLKPLAPSSIKIIVNEQGLIKRYEQTDKTPKHKVIRKFEPEEIFHIVNDRIADEIHGTSITEAVEWVILARNEAMADQQRLLHRNIVPVRIIEYDDDDTSKRDKLKQEYQEAINLGEVLVIPKGLVEIKEAPISTVDSLPWIKYLENFFYQAVGIPKVILGGSEEFTEASSKISYLTYEQIYTREITELESDLWNQLAIRLKFNKPASLKNEMLSSEDKNTGQTSFQPKDTEITGGRE